MVKKTDRLANSKAVQRLLSDVNEAISSLAQAVKHPSDKERILRYKVVMRQPGKDDELPFMTTRYEPRSFSPRKVCCVYALLNDLTHKVWRAIMKPEEGDLRCYDHIKAIQQITEKGLDNCEILGNITEGYYLLA